MAKNYKVTLRNHMITNPKVIASVTKKVFPDPESAQKFAALWYDFPCTEVIIEEVEEGDKTK